MKKRTEELGVEVQERRQAEEKLRAMLDSIGDHMSMMDGDLNILWANETAMQIFGNDIIGKKCYAAYHRREKPREPYPCLTLKAFQDGKIHEHDTQVIGQEGNMIYFHCTANVVLRDRDGKPAAVIEISRDISSQKKAEEALGESEEKFRSICASAQDAIIIMDNEGDISYWNEAAEKIFGYSSQEALGKDVHSFLAPENYLEAYKKGFQEFKESGTGPVVEKTLELVAVKKDGTEFPIELSISAVKLKGKWNAIGMIRDITKRKQAEEEIRVHLDHLQALRNIDIAITGSVDLKVTLNVLLEQVLSQLGVDAARVLLRNKHTVSLEYAAGIGFNTDALIHSDMMLGESCAGHVALARKPLIIPDLSEAEEKLNCQSYSNVEGFRAYFGAPLIAKGQVKGVLEIFRRSPYTPASEWLGFFEALAGQAAIAIDNATMLDDLQRSHDELVIAYDRTIEGWAKALDYRDKETEGHSQRVTEMTLRIAREMGIREEELVHIRRGALLHDIGKLGVPDNVLFKPGKLTDEEWKVMKRHTTLARELLSPIDFLRPSLDIPYCHHEKWDGTGYPRGLKGNAIPLSARIFAVVDVWDALGSDRPYRLAWSREKVEGYLRDNAGSHFDPEVAEAFLRIEW